MSRDRTPDLMAKATATGYFPAPVRDQIIRSLGDDTVVGFVIQSAAFVNAGSGVAMRVTASVLTDTRLLRFVWFEDAPDQTPSSDGLGELERLWGDEERPAAGSGNVAVLSRDIPAAQPWDQPSSAPGSLTVTARTVALRQVVDVQTTVQFKQRDPANDPVPVSATVLMISPTLNSLRLVTATCADPACDKEHPIDGHAMQDALEFVVDVDHDGTEVLSAVLNFAAQVESAIA